MLYVVPTPVGNMEDMTLRALRILKEADVVLAEDTKREGLACARWGVTVRRFVSYHDHNEKEKAASCEAALMSDDRLQPANGIAPHPS